MKVKEILKKENEILIENAKHNDKVVDNVNWENMLLKKENSQLKERIEKAITILEKKPYLNKIEESLDILKGVK